MGGLEKLNRRFAICQKNKLNPFASRKIARISVFLISSVFARFASGRHPWAGERLVSGTFMRVDA
jgi:hypothetical protein